MLLVSTTIKHKLLISFFLVFIATSVFAQENSPYSRYGLGDIVPKQSIENRSMGGISAGYVDYDKRYDVKEIYLKAQSINFLNPATYSKMRITSFNLGFEVDSRTLRTLNPPKKFTANSAIISYLQLGLPLSKKHQLGLNIGLRPITRINYKLFTGERRTYSDLSIPSDTMNNLFEGTGGTNEVFVGIGKGFKNFSVGVNVGYLFGSKDYSTRKSILNDTVLYYKANYETKSTFGGLLLNAGIQYEINFNKKTQLILGAYGNVRQKINGRQDIIRETFDYDASGATYNIDTVEIKKDVAGKVEYPSNIGIGFTLKQFDNWLIGADFSTTSWSKYSFFGTKDAVANSWMLHVGGQFTLDASNPKGYWNHVAFRLGFNYGPDYIKPNGKNLNQFGISFGAGLPVRKNYLSNQASLVNLGIEYGKRGNNNNVLQENLFRVSLGFTLSDLWFIKKKYY